MISHVRTVVAVVALVWHGRKAVRTRGKRSMSKPVIAAVAALAVSVGLGMSQPALAAKTIKIGLILPYTSVNAEFAQQIDRGIELYLKLHATEIKPYKIELIRRDAKNADGADAKAAAQELLTQDKVDALIGWLYSPNAIATAPLLNAANKLGIIVNAGTAWITQLSPDFVRTGFTMWSSGYTMGVAAAKQLHAKTAVVAYTDYPPGKDNVDAFKAGFEANGGKVIDSIPTGGPDKVPDFTPFFQHAENEHPDVLFQFASGPIAVAAVKTYQALGMRAAGIKLIGPGDLVQEIYLKQMGDAAIGLITMIHYNAELDNPQNKRFVAAWKEAYGPNSLPDFSAIGGWDGAAALVHAITETKGNLDNGKAAVKTLLGWKYDSPQGPIEIDPSTGDIIMNEYLDEVYKDKDGKLRERVLATYPRVKDECKVLGFGRCGKLPRR
ncbi:MAG: ABC transporter substrate-binding protein [Xanthobacteraceae bacterium]